MRSRKKACKQRLKCMGCVWGVHEVCMGRGQISDKSRARMGRGFIDKFHPLTIINGLSLRP
jgi:hypothetical protein